MRTELDNVLERLTADRTFSPDWGEILRRAELDPARPAKSWLVPRAALASLALVLLAGTALAAAGVGPFGSIRSWLSGTPGQPASPAAQRAFRSANGHTWGAFPKSTKLRKLVSATFAGEHFTLYGFRSGRSLCLTLRADTIRASLAPACAPISVVEKMTEPVVPVAADRTVAAFPERRSPQVSFGIAADQATAVTVVTSSGRHRARLGGNAYLWADPEPTTLDRVTALTVQLESGGNASIPIPPLDPMEASLHAQSAAGPTAVQEPLLHPHVGWLQRGERRGAAPTATQRKQLEHLPMAFGGQGTANGLRLFKPDPASDIVVGISGGCVYLDDGVGCTKPSQLFARGPLQFMISGGTSLNSSDSFSDIGGIAADGVAAIRVFFPSGASEQLALKDNMFAAVIPNQSPLRLVAYNAGGRIVGIETFGAFTRMAPPAARRLTNVLSLRGPRGVTARLVFGSEVDNVRCWRLTTTAGPAQSACTVIPMTGPWVTPIALQPAGRDVFVIGWTRAPVASVSLQFDDKHESAARMLDGWFLAAVPGNELSTQRRHALLVGRRSTGATVQHPPIFYRADR